MTLLEWLGVAFIISVCYKVFKGLKPNLFSKDPRYSYREYEFERMGKALDLLYDLRDCPSAPHNETVSNVQHALDSLIHHIVPLPKDSFASDYLSKCVDYKVIALFASAIIEAEESGIKLRVQPLK